jgi:hypothetical protein
MLCFQGSRPRSSSAPFWQCLIWAMGFAAAALVSCGPDAPPRSMLETPKPASVDLVLRSRSGIAVSMPRAFVRPVKLRFACASLLLQTPDLRNGQEPLECVELGTRPQGIDAGDVDSQSGTGVSAPGGPASASLTAWIQSGSVVIEIPAPASLSDDALSAWAAASQ